MYIYIFIYIYIYIYIYIHIYLCVYIHTYTYTHTHMYTHIQIYIHTHTHSHSHIHTFVAGASTVFRSVLAYTRYLFTCFCVCTNLSSLHYPRPFALPTLLQYYCATFAQCMTSPRPSLYMPYTIQYW